jgi:hypothetical protein
MFRTDFSINEQKLAFKKLVNKKKTFFDTLFELEFDINKDDITECLYCGSILNSKSKNFKALKFCKNICRDIYLSIYNNLYSINSSLKNITLPNFTFFNDKNISSFLNSLDNNLSILRIFSIRENIGKLEIYIDYLDEDENIVRSKEILSINEYVSKKISTNKLVDSCLYCLSLWDTDKKPKFLRTAYDTYIGPFCSKICKISYTDSICRIIPLHKEYIFTLSDYRLIKKKFDVFKKYSNKDCIIGGFESIKLDNNSIHMRFKILLKPQS